MKYIDRQVFEFKYIEREGEGNMWFFLKVLYFLKMHWAIIRWVKPLRVHKAHHKSILFWWLRVAVLSYIFRVLRTVIFFVAWVYCRPFVIL